MKTKKLLTPPEIERSFGLGQAMVRTVVDAGELPAFRIRDRILVDPADLAAFLAAHRVGPSTPIPTAEMGLEP